MGSAGHLSGRVAIVVGSSRGIGRAVAQALAREGASVVVNGREAAAAAEVARELVAGGGLACAVPGSAADASVAEALVDAAIGELGGLDILVNCAGIAEPSASSILNLTTAQWRELIDAHLTATFETCRAVAPHLVRQRRGSIVNTSSHAFTGAYGGTGYPAGKGGVNALTRAIAAELREHGVRANAVCPGAATRLSSGEAYERRVEALFARGLLDAAARHASLHPDPPGYAAPLYAFLASDLAAGITGEIFAGSGGFLGRFERPKLERIAWRDPARNPPWSLEEIASLLAADGAGAP